MTIINLTTPMSDDKERQRQSAAMIAAIEQYTEERMNDEYGKIHTDGSRSGGQPVPRDVNERLGAWLSAALDDPNCSEAFKQDINDWFASHTTQSGALQADALDFALQADALDFGSELIFACAGLRHEPIDTEAIFSITWDGFPYDVTIRAAKGQSK